MKPSRFFSLVVLGTLFVIGCQGNPIGRVLRVSIEDGATNLQFNIDGDRPQVFASTSDFREHISQLRIRQGDLIIARDWPTVTGSQNAALGEWLSGYCLSNNVAVYLYKGAQSNSELFQIPIFNWTTPFDDPRQLSTAFFFYNGTPLGGGQPGFETMVRLISKVNSGKILILGSRYNMDAGFGSSECPFVKEQDALDKILNQNHIKQILVDPLF